MKTLLIRFSWVVAAWASIAFAQDAGPSPRALAVSCDADGYDEDECVAAIAALERAAPADEASRLALAQAYLGSAYAHAPYTPEHQALKAKAVDQLRSLVKGGSKNPEVYAHLASEVTDPAEQARLNARAAELAPTNADALQRLAVSQLQSGQAAAALKTHQRYRLAAGKADLGDEVEWANELARAGRTNEAAAAAKLALSDAAKEPRLSRCWAVVRLEPPVASALAPLSRELLPYCTRRDHLSKARSLARQGKATEAIKEGEAQRAENPKAPETYPLLDRLYAATDAKKAAGVLAAFFAQEKDPVDRCALYGSLSSAAKGRLDAALAADLEKSCPGPQ